MKFSKKISFVFFKNHRISTNSNSTTSQFLPFREIGRKFRHSFLVFMQTRYLRFINNNSGSSEINIFKVRTQI